jgi:hypothetical protein
MKNHKRNNTGINAFSFLYFVGIIFVVEQIIEYSQCTVQLAKRWQLPEAPFFSKIIVAPEEVEISINLYITFAIAYIVFYFFILIGLIQLNKSVVLLSEKKLFLPEIGLSFKKEANSFMIFIIGTLIVDIVWLFMASTSRPILDLIATESIVFIILTFLLYFLSDILNEGTHLKEENELTI